MRLGRSRLARLALVVVAVALAVFGTADLTAGRSRDVPTDLAVLTSGAVHGAPALAERPRDASPRGTDLWHGSGTLVLSTSAAFLLAVLGVVRVSRSGVTHTWRRRGPPLILVS